MDPIKTDSSTYTLVDVDVGTAVDEQTQTFVDFMKSSWEEKLKDIDTLIEQAYKKQGCVGLGVGIVANGKRVFAKGYGQRDYTRNDMPVTGKTVFALGSVTKQFTAYALDTLVNVDGTVDWDDLVIDHIREFRMSDPSTTGRIKLKDLGCHHSGLPRHELVHLYSDMTKEDLIARIPHLQPVYDLREAWVYNNMMYGMLGVVIERTTGKKWEDVVTERIFKPLKMDGSYTSIDEALQNLVTDIAQPHSIFGSDGKVRHVRWNNARPVNSAGAIVTTTEDMTTWMEHHLRLTGPPKAMHVPYASLPADPTTGANFGYGYAWMLAFYHGRLMVWHSGKTDGFVSRVNLFPELNQGVVVLVNMDVMQPFNNDLSLHIADILSGYSTLRSKSVQDWLSTLVPLTRASGAPEPVVQDKPTLPDQAEQYEGDYEHPGYGLINVSVVESTKLIAASKKLVATYNTVEYTLVPREDGSNKDAFSATATSPLEMKFKCSFARNAENDVFGTFFHFETSLAMPTFFVRKPSHDLLTPEYLKSFEGVYKNASSFVRISLNGVNTLVASGSLQFSGKLTPFKRDVFILESATPAQFRFETENGKVSELTAQIGEYGISFKKST